LSKRNFKFNSETFTSIRGTGERDIFVYNGSGSFDDNISGVISLGFNFQFGNQSFNTIQLSVNGIVFFGATTSNFTNALSNLTFPSICAYWDDLKQTTNGHYIVYKKVGGDFIIEYKLTAYSNFTDTIWFQIILQQTTNKIYIKFRNSNPASPSTSGTIGYFFSSSEYYSYDPSSNCFAKNAMFTNVNTNEFVQPTTIEFDQSLVGANMSHMYLRGYNLSGFDLTGADLSYTDLTGANLTGANLTGANLTGVIQ
jgi:uncharacterized protein YjbI with pentapeptide repeats